MAERDYKEALSLVDGDDPTPEAMSRMADHISRAVESRAIGSGTVAEEHDRDEGEAVMVELEQESEGADSDMWRRLRWSMVAAAVLIVVGIAIALVRDDGDGTEIGPLGDVTTTAPPQITEPPTTGAPAVVEPTFEGSWTAGNLDVVFEGDTYRLVIDGETRDQGTFRALTDTVRLTSTPESVTCDAGSSLVVTYEFDGNDSLSLVWEQEDGCDLARPISPLALSFSFTRVE